MEKATRKHVKRHNRQLVMRAIYEAKADNRAALAHETGLTKPTVSNIVNDLLHHGFVQEVGRGESTASGGKRPTLLSFIPTARQVIGLSLSSTEVVGCLSNLDGAFVARHSVLVSETIPLMLALDYTIKALIAQSDAKILCISVGVPGVINQETGIIISSPALNWYNVNLAEKLRHEYGHTAHVGNNTEFATRTQMVYGSKGDTHNLVTLFIGDTIEVGSKFGADYYQHGGDISILPLPHYPNEAAFLRWSNIKARVQALIEQYPDSLLANGTSPLFLDMRRACLLNDNAALIIQDEIASALAQVYAWIIALMRPDEIVLAGVMSLMGQSLIDKTCIKLLTLLPESAVSATRLSLAELSQHLELRGAVAHALNQELGIV
jgi:predicted NBD/HSP70 family sugar kinase